MKRYIEAYQREYQPMIQELIYEDNFVKEDIVKLLEEYPQHGVVVQDQGEIVAVGVFLGEDNQSSMTLYVKPSKRQQGIGTLLLRALEIKMREVGIQEIICDFKKSEREQAFLYKNGYKHWFDSNFMIYTGEKLAVSNHTIIHYKDEDYRECQKIFSEAFHEMRLSVGLESSLSSPSEIEKEQYRRNVTNLFVLQENQQIIAVVKLQENEIDAIAVDIHKQGRGYGKSLVSYAVNELLERGYKHITLWALEGNKAKFLYEKLGFNTERIHEFVKKSIS